MLIDNNSRHYMLNPQPSEFTCELNMCMSSFSLLPLYLTLFSFIFYHRMLVKFSAY